MNGREEEERERGKRKRKEKEEKGKRKKIEKGDRERGNRGVSFSLLSNRLYFFTVFILWEATE